MEEIKEKEDFNVRKRNKDKPIEEERKKEQEIRRSKDKVINKEGQVMLN